MKILIVSSSILPQTGGSSVIVENLAQCFSSDELTVFGSSTWRPKAVPGRKDNGPDFLYFFTEMYFMGRGNRYFRWFRKMRFSQMVKAIERTIVERQITHVIGVFPNIDYCLAACRAASNLSVAFSSYFHNTYIENTSISDKLGKVWQEEIFKASNNIFVMSKGMQVYYEERYQLNKFKPLVHTFNQYPPHENQTGIPGNTKKFYKLVAIGNFNESNLEASRRVVNAIKDDPRFSLSLYTHVPKLLLEKRGMNPNHFNHMGAVSPEDVNKVIQQYDICVLTHGFTGGYGEIEYQTIFPTRTIPLLLSGKPILAHSPKKSFLNQFIEENQCAHLIDEPSEEAIVSGLESIISDIEYQKKLVSKSEKTAKLFYGPEVTDHLKQELAKS